MNFHHSTAWPTLEKILLRERIDPRPLDPVDRQQCYLGQLASLDVHCAWFSSQAWTTNIFGPYVLRFPGQELVPGPLVDLDRHHGARCFLSAPERLASWISAKIGRPMIASGNPAWHPADKTDRVDVLTSWSVPIGNDLYFVQGSTKGSIRENNANFASARFTARMLLCGETRFNESLQGPSLPERSGNLLRQLTGEYATGFDAARTGSGHAAGAASAQLLRNALQCLVDADPRSALSHTASIGPLQQVAAELAVLINEHFASSLTGAEIIEAC